MSVLSLEQDIDHFHCEMRKHYSGTLAINACHDLRDHLQELFERITEHDYDCEGLCNCLIVSQMVHDALEQLTRFLHGQVIVGVVQASGLPVAFEDFFEM